MATATGESSSNEGKKKTIEEEMSRFEQEILGLTNEAASATQPPSSRNAVHTSGGIPRALGFQPRQTARPGSTISSGPSRPPGPAGNRPAFVPHQVRVTPRPSGPRLPHLFPPPPPPPMAPMGRMPPMGPPQSNMNQPHMGGPPLLPPPPMPPMPNFPVMPPMGQRPMGPPANQVTISSKPTSYSAKPVLFGKKKKAEKKEKNAAPKESAAGKSKEEPKSNANTSAPPVIPPPMPQPTLSQPHIEVPSVSHEVQPPLHSFAPTTDLTQVTQGGTYELGTASEPLKKKDKKKKFLRTAAGMTWEDDSLQEWDPNDFRLFAGDLGNEVTEDTLTKVFGTYPSFLRAKIIRDKRTNKTKGYGFISFKDPADFVQAMKDWNGKYVGNRPIKLLKSTWRDRDLSTVKKKVKEKERLGLR